MSQTTETTATDDAPGALGYVIDAIRAGRHASIASLVARLSPARRRELSGELPALRKELRDLGWNDWERRDGMRVALLLAGAGCHTGAATAASWLGSRVLRDWNGLPTERLLGVLADRDPAWLGDVAHRLAARTSTAEEDYPLIRALVRLAGCPLPTSSDGFVHGWAQDMAWLNVRDRPRARRLSEALRADPAAPELVARLFETVEPADALLRFGDPEQHEHWPAVLARLAADGTLDRSMLVRGTVSRLVRGGRPQHLRVFTALLRTLDLTAEEEREHTADWMALAADGPSPVAADAQQVLTRLWQSGELPAERLAELAEAVLFRPEKKLVRAQLVLLGKALRRDPKARHVLLPATAAAFSHQDTALQERALALAARYLRPEDTALREELAGQAELLSPTHQAAAAELFGTRPDGVADDEPYEEVLPPAPVTRRLPPAPDTVAETVELVVALVRAGQSDAAEFETALDGLVRHAHRDRPALAEGLAGLLADGWRWETGTHGMVDIDRLDWLEVVAAAVLGRLRPTDLPDRPAPRSHRRGGCVHEARDQVLRARVYEAAHRVLTAPLPFLLATPTWETGTIDPEELVGRLAAYAREGLEPTPADFAQALLRVRRDPAAAPSAAGLGTPAGKRLAEWLASPAEAGDRLVRQTREPAVDNVRPWNRAREGVRRLVVEIGGWLAPQHQFPPGFHTLARPRSGTIERCWHWHRMDGVHRAMLPEDRETQAAWALPEVTACATADESGGCAMLPPLAELGGEAGPVLHLAVATGLGARHTEDRLAAVDALLVLAARGDLDTDRIGRDLAELLGLGTVKPTRLADAARTAAATGAYATTWAVLAPALPALLTDPAAGPAPRGAGELLAVAADCVERCGTTGPYPEGLDAAADRKGSSQYVSQARRLRTALGGAVGGAG
ncbi:DUF6493 family protein [Streptomyces lichenis]|uniref:DUF6493 family protein n=1 Tax=Streptomyces lichenis TaxID=2306967 RepID=A0ABT0I897_9ACTN|nr:DUF6493 family protein [Streptomyces lichenis]MCK8677536.1 DUF6493 family protein [Streptomyces lichenis]